MLDEVEICKEFSLVHPLALKNKNCRIITILGLISNLSCDWPATTDPVPPQGALTALIPLWHLARRLSVRHKVSNPHLTIDLPPMTLKKTCLLYDQLRDIYSPKLDFVILYGFLNVLGIYSYN